MGNTKVAILFAVRRVSDSKREFESSNFVRTVISLRRPAHALAISIAASAFLAAITQFRHLTLKVAIYKHFAGTVPNQLK